MALQPFIEIENGIVRQGNREVLAEVALADWMPLVETRSAVTLPILPRSAVAVHYDDRDPQHAILHVALELPPSIQNINLSGYMHRLSMPWTVFHFKLTSSNPLSDESWGFDDYSVWFSRNRIQRLTDPLIVALLPNVYEDGRICFGSTAPDGRMTIADRLDIIVNNWYSNEFNHDLHIRIPNGRNGYTQWERMTQSRPMAWTEWRNWEQDPQHTLQELFERQLQRTDPVMVEGRMPEIPMGATFGRAEEVIAAFSSNNDRLRFEAAITNLRAERPELFTEVATAPVIDDDDADDDDINNLNDEEDENE